MSNYTTADVQIAYVAFFGRPAEPAGLDFWMSVSDSISKEAMFADFANQAEYRSYYADFIDTTTGEITDAVGMLNEVYNNLFHRDVLAEGIAFWGPLLTDGTVTIDDVVLEVLAGAQNEDLVAVNSKIDAAVAFTAEARATDYHGYAGDEAAAEAHEWLSEVYDAATLASAVEPTALHDAVVDVMTPDVPAPVDQTFILTEGQDILTGGDGNDVFKSTEKTLQLGDDLDGGAGADTLTVSISGDALIDGFATKSIETIEVKSLSLNPSVLDLSDVEGLATLVSNETDGASLTFKDIQSVNDVDISIIDSKEEHNYGYDLNAYDLAGVDNVDLRLEEVRNAVINFFNTNGSVALGVEQITIDSETLLDPTLGRNLVDALNVGDHLETVFINGNADLEITEALDQNITLLDATGLDAKLTLDMSEANPALDLITFMGAQDDTNITFGTAANAKSITTFGGDDTILAGEGNNTISSGDGDDYVSAGDGDDVIDGGAGADTIYAGAGDNEIYGGDQSDDIYSGAGKDTVFGGEGNDYLWDLGGNNVISMGNGSDEVYIGEWNGSSLYDGMGNNNIDLGDGDDLLGMDAKELEVADTITGGEGYDTFQLFNSTGRADYGKVLGSETQRTTSIEEFDLRDAQIYLTLTDNLISSAENETITVNTQNSVGTQTVDITNITAPDYHFTLLGGENKEVVVADDMTVNSMSTMAFDGGVSDTLIVTDEANISATDTDNISGLEWIILKGNTEWNIDLTSQLINQTSGNATLYIKVDPDVPAGSKLYLNTVGTISAPNDVVVLRNSNVTVYLDGNVISADGMALDYDGTGALYIDTPLEFTENADSLIGTAGDDTFYATSIDQLDASDIADGLGHVNGDTLVLGAGLYAGTAAWDQMNNAKLNNIEILEFSEDVSYGVSFEDDYNAGDYEFSWYKLTPGADSVTDARSGHGFEMYGGDDFLQLDDSADNVTVDGGLGDDTVDMYDGFGLYGSASVHIADVETVYGGYNDDTVHILDANTAAINMELYGGEDWVDGSANGDVITVDGGSGEDTVDGNGGADDIVTYQVESVTGGDGNDTIVSYDDESGADDSVFGNDGNDHITATNFEVISGGAGDDEITVISDELLGNSDTIYGDEVDPTIDGGDDLIDVLGNVGEDTIVFGTEKGTDVTNATLFGNAAHPTGYDVTVTSGYDTISGFTARATTGTVDDLLDVSQLLGNDGGIDVDTVNFADAFGFDHNFSGGSADNVIIAYNAPTDIDGNIVLDETNFTVTGFGGDNVFRLEDDGEAVLALTSASDPDNVTELELFYVCDTDDAPGASWNIVEIGVVTFDGNGNIGLSGGSFEDNWIA